MPFDPSLILAYLQGVGPQSASAIASFTSFFLDVRSFFEERSRSEKATTIDDYLEWLRRKDHRELVDLIGNHRDTFEVAFAGLQQGLLNEFERVHAKIDQLHSDFADMTADPKRISISQHTDWMAESVTTITEALQNTKLCAKVLLVNKNRTALTLRSAHGKLFRNAESFPVTLRQQGQVIAGNGASAEVWLITADTLGYRKGDKLILSEIALRFDQSKNPLSFQWNGDGYEPIKPT